MDMNQTNSNKVDAGRRALLTKGATYAALVPASTVLITKSARASGSNGVFTFTNGNTSTSGFGCASAGGNPEEVAACVNFFLGG